jgi:hypothetical protein
MPIGVDVPHVGHRVAPGWRLSPHVEQRIAHREKGMT